MSQLQDFLWEDSQSPVTSSVSLQGITQPFVVKSITEGENKALRKSCQSSRIDPKTRRPMVHTDLDLYYNRLVVACCVEPNFKDAALQQRFGVLGAEALVDAALKPGQYLDLLYAVQEVNGFSVGGEDMRQAAKN